MAKRFFYVSAALLMLALSYHLGAERATAQGTSNPVVGIAWDGSEGGGGLIQVVTSNGDVYLASGGRGAMYPAYRGNIFGAPTPATTTSWGKVKADYRK